VLAGERRVGGRRVSELADDLGAGWPSVTCVPLTIVPPADCTSELNQTTTPSYCAPWISMCVLSRVASSIRSDQVLGTCLTLSLRYQSN
jgi:hypothetical protein